MKYAFGVTLIVSLFYCGCDSKNEPPTTEPQSVSAQASTSAQRAVPMEQTAAKTIKPAGPDFFEAALNGNAAVVESELRAGVEVNATNPEGRNALMLAAFNGHTEIVKSVLAGGARINECDEVGRTALMFASSGSNNATVRLLLEYKAEVNIADKLEKWTALMFAAAEGQTAIVRMLLENGADWKLQDVDGDTALNFAMNNRHEQTAELLKCYQK